MLAVKIVLGSLLTAISFHVGLSQQPEVITLEKTPARRSSGVIAIPEGSPWCGGRPTIWIPGHKDFVEDRPDCLFGKNWRQSHRAVLDIIDDLNKIDNPTVQDRHDCGVLDINNDGKMDIYCTVGANSGTGFGYNEIYLTRDNGTLRKVERHGLQRFYGARTRVTTVLKTVNNTELVFIGTSGGRRQDGWPNKHAMFVKTGKWHRNPMKKYFHHQPGPWQRYTTATCALAVDVNGDGLDDLVVCNKGPTKSFLFQQRKDGTFYRNAWTLQGRRVNNWRQARVGDFDGDGIDDLAVVYHGAANSFLNVFKGSRTEPYFDFNITYYSRELPYAAPDLEVVDANRDGIMDLYVVQAEEFSTERSYCGGRNVNKEGWWPYNKRSPMTPPVDWIPPVDTAPDLLFLGNPGAPLKLDRFQSVEMQHQEPGCGFYVKKFTNHSLILAQGGFVRPGHQLLLEW